MRYVGGFLILALALLASCTPKDQAVQVKTGGIFVPVSFKLDGQEVTPEPMDLGEFVLETDPRNITLTVKNNTEFPLTDLDLEIVLTDSTVTSFIPDEEGQLTFPGFGGTCGSVLHAGRSCTIALVFAPRVGQMYTQDIILKYKNLVDAETRTGSFFILAGVPASLVFTNDITAYEFGTKVGLAQTPVVERSEPVEFVQDLEIRNAGGLSARNVLVDLNQSCFSAVSGSCPAGMGGAFSFTTDCPRKLDIGQVCHAQVKYLPKNQDPTVGAVPEEIKELRYTSNIRLAYAKDPMLTPAALNAYFTSVSTTIEAKFQTTVENVVFETPIVSGNRDVRTIRINNTGYREGEIKKLIFKDNSFGHMATCLGDDNNDYLKCYNASMLAEKTLEEFPFFIKDRNDCLKGPGEGSVTLVPVSNGCIFDINFQPSVNYLTDKAVEFQNMQVEVEYDSRWKGLEVIKNRNLFSMSASSLAAARLVADRINYGPDAFLPLTAGITPAWFDFQRQGLQSPTYFKRKNVSITYRNVGSVPATNISIKDGSGKIIPFTDDNPAGVNLGASVPYYWTKTLANSDFCRVIEPNKTCSITSSFAPIGMDTNGEESANMFDHVDADPYLSYKSFQVTYDNAALYSDSNLLTTTRDIALQISEARVNTVLVRKGVMLEYYEDPDNRSTISGFPFGDTVYFHYYIKNIGTGPITYIKPLKLWGYPVTAGWEMVDFLVMPTANPAALGADHDCMDIIDKYPYSTTSPELRPADYASLPKDESCVMTVRYLAPEGQKAFSFQQPGSSETADSTNSRRFFTREAMNAGGSALWEFRDQGYADWIIDLRYFDGDISNPNPGPGFIADLGTPFEMEEGKVANQPSAPAKINPSLPVPWIGATIWRPEFTLEDFDGDHGLGDPEGPPAAGSLTIPETWYFNGLTSVVDGTTPALVKSHRSRFRVPLLNDFISEKDDVDYVLYIGAFPQNSGTVQSVLTLTNVGKKGAKLTSVVWDLPAGMSVTAPVGQTVLPVGLAPDATYKPTINLSTTTAGEYRALLTYTFDTGSFVNPITFYKDSIDGLAGVQNTRTMKILVLGEVIENHAEFAVDVYDYEVQARENDVPLETMSPTPVAMSIAWNLATPAAVTTFDTMKIPSTPTAYDVYAKKRFVIRNVNPTAATNFSFNMRPATAASAGDTLPASVTINWMTCAGKTSFAPAGSAGDSCTMEIKYQPRSSDSLKTTYMTLAYEIGTDAYAFQNVGLSLYPRAPAQVTAVALTAKPINYALPDNSIRQENSYPLPIGNSEVLVTNPQTYTFDRFTGSSWKVITLNNSQPTKASLLKNYHEYLYQLNPRAFTAGATGYPVSSEVPGAGEYRTVNSEQFAIIWKIRKNSQDRIVVEASKGCFFGDDELAAIPHYEKGFSSTSIKKCYIIASINLRLNDIATKLDPQVGVSMRDNAFPLRYYSVFRSAEGQPLFLNFEGTLKPNTSYKTTGQDFTNVWSKENRRIGFTLPTFYSLQPELGDIVGYRVFRGATLADVANVYANTMTNYLDLGVNSFDASFISGLANGKFYYFKVATIRYHSEYTVTGKFPGLGAGMYLSEVANMTTPLKIPVPPLNHFYDHATKVVVDKNLNGNNGNPQFIAYSAANSQCSSRTKMIIQDGTSNTLFTYRLMNQNVWNLAKADPTHNGYSNYLRVSHWLSDATIAVDSFFGGVAGYVPGQSSQLFEANKLYYLRDSNCPACNVNRVVGGIPGTEYEDFFSGVPGGVPFASPRCYVLLP